MLHPTSTAGFAFMYNILTVFITSEFIYEALRLQQVWHQWGWQAGLQGVLWDDQEEGGREKYINWWNFLLLHESNLCVKFQTINGCFWFKFGIGIEFKILPSLKVSKHIKRGT